MELREARHIAGQLLVKVIEHQPDVFRTTQPVSGAAGEAAAHFCDRFIETYAAALIKKVQ